MTAQALRAVRPGEKPPARGKAKSVTQAADSGTQRELLVAMRARIAKTIEDPKCPPRDLSSLSRRLIEIAREIEAIDSDGGGDDIGEAAATPDEAFDPSAV